MIGEITQQLLQLLARWDRRLRLQQSFVWVPRGLIGGVGLGIGLAAAARLWPILLPQQVIIGALIAVALGLLIALAWIWLARRDALSMARRFDGLFGLKERVSTSLELAAGRIRSPNEEITRRLLDDTLTRAKTVNPGAYLPLRLVRRDWLVLVGLVVLLVLLVVTDNPQGTALAQQQTIQNVIQQQVDQLESLREQIASEPGLDEATRDELLEELDRALEELSQDDLSQEEAVATMSELSDQFSEMAEAEAQTLAEQQQALQEAAERLQEALGETIAETPQTQDLSQVLQQLAAQMEGMGQTAQQDMAEALDDAMQIVSSGTPELSEALQEAAQALEEGDLEAAREALDEAMEQATQAQQMAQAFETPQQDTTGSETPQTGQSGRQIASQAAEQIQASAQEVAEAGSEPQSAGQELGQAQPGDSAVPIPQTSEEQPGMAGQAGQANESDMAQPGGSGSEESEFETGQAGETQGEDSGSGAGAGDSTGGETEGGFASTGEQIDQGNNPDGGGTVQENLDAAPETIGGEGGQDVQLDASRDSEGRVVQEGILSQSPDGQSIVDYSQVYSNYANAANQALERDYIPLSLRDVVRNYFSSLEP